jgi:hypothetical protein
LPITKSQRADAALQVGRRLAQALTQRYPGVFSPSQIKALTGPGITADDAAAILTIAAGKAEARRIGGDFQRQVAQALKKYPPTDSKHLNAWVPISQAADKLPKEAGERFHANLSRDVPEVTAPMLDITAVFETDPVWSPDGKSLAFARYSMPWPPCRLVVVDLATHKTRTLFESDGIIEGVSWTRNGNSLVLQAKRNLAYKRAANGQSCDYITMPSYPEIWLIDLK